MTTYNAPIKDMLFILHEMLEIDKAELPGYEEVDLATLTAILNEAGKLAKNVLHPLNAVGDSKGCRLEDGIVHTPKGFAEGFTALKEGGWIGLDCNPDYGGQGMPYLIATATSEIFSAANQALAMYSGLTHGAYSAIHAHGDEGQKALYLPKLTSGEWCGTMNLTEAHCGTDLGLIRTRAELEGDGSYRLTGEKIFISSGDHDLSENIIHLVLARMANAPEGVKGISLFIVPKFLSTGAGKRGDRNAVMTNKIEHKMGIHGNSTCVMQYDGAVGYLLGEAHKGMRAMFTMMNEARLNVGLQGYSQASIAYQNALTYAKERLQGRDVGGAKNPDEMADPLIVHPDIRRSLMDQKSFVEGARALVFWGAHLIDQAVRGGDEEAEGMISLLTPVIKGFLSDKGFEATIAAQQIYGGHGYIEESGMSQFVRDARIAMIYEGANGVQALDLVGRKLAQDNGKYMIAFIETIKAFLKENAQNDVLKTDFLEPLKQGSKDLQAAAMYFVQHGMKNPHNALAGSYDFMTLFGHVCLGFMWARMAKIAAEKSGGRDAAFYEAKLASGRYYMARHIPATALHLARITSGAGPVMALAPEAF